MIIKMLICVDDNTYHKDIEPDINNLKNSEYYNSSIIIKDFTASPLLYNVNGKVVSDSSETTKLPKDENGLIKSKFIEIDSVELFNFEIIAHILYSVNLLESTKSNDIAIRYIYLTSNDDIEEGESDMGYIYSDSLVWEYNFITP